MESKMDKFKQHNAKHKIISCARLTPDGKAVYTEDDFERSDRAVYRFNDGTAITLKDADKDLNYSPVWAF